MSLRDFFRKQFVDVIHWTEVDDGVLAYRFPMQDMEIQYGAQLTVRESQLALFVNEGKVADAFAPGLVDLAVRRYVDLDGLVATVDLDAVAAKLDVDAVIDRVDLNEVAKGLDVEAVVARVDLDKIAEQIDIEKILDRLDLTTTVTTRVDLKRIIDEVLASMDLPALVEEVMDEIDLPEIIRGSTGTMASDTVQTVRMQGVSADELVNRTVDRILLRRKHARTTPGATPGAAPGAG